MGFFSGLLKAAPLVSSALSFIGGERANNKTEDLSNTAYQRGMADMKAAGLNPILAGKYGGASTPMMQNTIAPAVQAGWSARQTQSSTNLQDTQAQQVSVQVDKTVQEISNLAATKNLTEAQTENVAAAIELIKAQAAHEILKHKKTIADTTGQEQMNVIKSIATNFLKSAKFPELSTSSGGTIGTVVNQIINTSTKGYEGLFNLKKYGVSLENTKLVIQQLMREYFRGNGS